MSNWRYVKAIKDGRQIKEVEREFGITFEQSYVDFLEKYNGGRPPLSELDSVEFSDLIIKTFLSLNKEDLENVYEYSKSISEIDKNLVPFANDDNGNFYCFDKTKMGVFFLNLDPEEEIKIANSFKDFLKMVDPES